MTKIAVILGTIYSITRSQAMEIGKKVASNKQNDKAAYVGMARIAYSICLFQNCLYLYEK